MKLAAKAFDPAAIVKSFPPKVKDRNVALVYEMADAAGGTYTGEISYSRWAELPLPADIPAGANFTDTASPDFFTYDADEAADPAAVVWHLNFAHFDLFRYYGSGLFAQDEMQVAEHPVLASLREALLHEQFSTLTVEDGRPTPILLRGAERRVRVATEPNASEGRPGGLYGNRFSQAPLDVARKAITRLDPSTVSNIIAMEAPPGGSGEYSTAQIRFILTTAYTAFRAAAEESYSSAPGAKVVVHTGFWGCGAYGGNRVLMTMLQLYAAKMAQVTRMVFHTGDKYGIAQYKTAKETMKALEREFTNTESVIAQLAKRGFRWGTSDGN